ncbi:STAS domain-containing protein [Amycolatopsis sp. NPDC051903]|uniref:STAS domain-containing protein n=1 Tax=Amycolatopsis sp. NPDC051903 TaxID=3363936 RepID=UPI00379D5CFA
MSVPHRIEPVPDHPCEAGFDHGVLRLRVHRPTPDATVVEAVGEVDACTAPHLAEVVQCRLRGAVTIVAVDLTGVTFLAIRGLEVVRRLALLARELEVEFAVDPGSSHAVQRLLQRVPLGCERPGIAAALTTLTVPEQRDRRVR